MELNPKDKLILMQNLLNRATEIAIAKYGSDVTLEQVEELLNGLAKMVGQRIKKIGG